MARAERHRNALTLRYLQPVCVVTRRPFDPPHPLPSPPPLPLWQQVLPTPTSAAGGGRRAAHQEQPGPGRGPVGRPHHGAPVAMAGRRSPWRGAGRRGGAPVAVAGRRSFGAACSTCSSRSCVRRRGAPGAAGRNNAGATPAHAGSSRSFAFGIWRAFKGGPPGLGAPGKRQHRRALRRHQRRWGDQGCELRLGACPDVLGNALDIAQAILRSLLGRTLLDNSSQAT